MTNRLRAFHEAYDGQGLIEYGMILILASIAAVGVIALLGPVVADLFSRVLNALP